MVLRALPCFVSVSFISIIQAICVQSKFLGVGHLYVAHALTSACRGPCFWYFSKFIFSLDLPFVLVILSSLPQKKLGPKVDLFSAEYDWSFRLEELRELLLNCYRCHEHLILILIHFKCWNQTLFLFHSIEIVSRLDSLKRQHLRFLTAIGQSGLVELFW